MPSVFPLCLSLMILSIHCFISKNFNSTRMSDVMCWCFQFDWRFDRARTLKLTICIFGCIMTSHLLEILVCPTVVYKLSEKL